MKKLNPVKKPGMRIDRKYPRKGANDAKRRKQIEVYLDAGHGSCVLRDPRIGPMVEGALFQFDGQRYRLIEWVIMPNHVHLLAEFFAGSVLWEVLKSWKSFSAHEANRILGRSGQFWQEDYFDRFIRNPIHFENARRYIRENPVEAGLVKQPEVPREGDANLDVLVRTGAAKGSREVPRGTCGR